MIDAVALWLGYAVMVSGGVALVLGLLWLVAESCFRVWFSAWRMRDLLAATEEWKRLHPDKAVRWNKR